jgi:hypothetical protein
MHALGQATKAQLAAEQATVAAERAAFRAAMGVLFVDLLAAKYAERPLRCK